MMKKLLAIKLFIAALPFIVILAIYLYKDPFKILYKYDSYYTGATKYELILNQDFVSTETFLKNHVAANYDSYIFGSSRTTVFQIKYWQKYTGNTKAYHFDAWKEGLYGIERKTELLRKQKARAKNALIFLDEEVLEQVGNRQDFLRKHPALSGENIVYFHFFYLKEYLSINFLRLYLKFLITGERSYETIKIIGEARKNYDHHSNEVTIAMDENPADTVFSGVSELEKFVRYDLRYYGSDSTEKLDPAIIKEKQVRLLKRIKDNFSFWNTDYRIVINPLYNKKRMHPADVQKLCSIFGEERVFDFSGINDITTKIVNYYEFSHYRPHVAKWILDSVYRSKRPEKKLIVTN